MTEINQNCTVYQGNDKTITTVVKDAAGSPMNLVGITGLQWVLLLHPNSETAILTKTVGVGITVTDAAAGVVSILVVSTDTRTLAPFDYYQELRLYDSVGFKETLAVGRIQILPSRPF